MSRLILLFTLVPAMELILLVYLGREIGFWPTVALIVVPGVVGAVVAKSQGTRVLRRIQADVAAGRVPAYGLIDGLLILVGGVLLLAPGVLTDVVGIVLLVPYSRDWVKRRVRAALENAIRRGTLRVFPA
ncbi:MAG: FxsA family protein [Armatimonadetes bacterium]|nr:FxsA family protein [Armatimonadota bacterium]